MKFFALLFPCVALLCGGCAIENLDPAKVQPPSSPAQPDIRAKPSRQQRSAIMSGEKPDWSISADLPDQK